MPSLYHLQNLGSKRFHVIDNKDCSAHLIDVRHTFIKAYSLYQHGFDISE